jgi:Flp pilus assembly protein TadD
MALIVHGKGLGDEAATIVDKAIQLRAMDSLFHNTRAVICRSAGHFQTAAEAYRTALAIDHQMVQAYAGLASVLHFDIGDRAPTFEARRAAFEEAASHYRLCLEHSDLLRLIDSGDQRHHHDFLGAPLSATAEVSTLNDHAIVLQKLGRYREAVDLLRRATKAAPRHLQSAGNLAMALNEARDLTGALAEGRRAADIDPASAFVRYNLGLTLQSLDRMHEGEAVGRPAENPCPKKRLSVSVF